MNTLEIVLLSLLSGLFIAALIAAITYLAWMLHATRRFLVTVQESSKAASTDISLLRTQIESILNSHRQAMDTVVARINGDKLIEASTVIIRAAQRIETACVAFGELSRAMLTGDLTGDIAEPELRRAARSGLGPETYAPETGERFVGQSRTAAQDRDELLSESEPDIPE